MARITSRGIPQQPLPVSGEQVQGVPPATSPHRKAPKAVGQERRFGGAGERNEQRRAETKRQSWERSDVGQARTQDISAKMQATHGISATNGQIYDDLRRSGHIRQSTSGPTHYDRQLPGMADPNAAPRPPKWEELPEETRAHTTRALRLQGTSVERMASDFGAQHDQGVVRSVNVNSPTPYASTFYEPGSEQRRVLQASAREVDLPETIHAQMNAFTSPQTKFTQHHSSGGTSYPNDEAAKHAVRHADMGRDPSELRTNPAAREFRSTGMTHGEDTRSAQGYPANLEKAAQATAQFRTGVKPADWQTGQTGGSPWRSSPKTGPYANSWSDSHPQFFVSDIHSGGGGGLPHLSADKGNQGGKDDSERELAIKKVPFFHSAMDFAARQAMGARGLRSTRTAQATQWGEEQLQRGEAGMKSGPKQDRAYSGLTQTRREIPGQGSFDL